MSKYRFITLLLLLFFAGCSSTVIEKPPERAYVPALQQYHIGIGDMVKIDVWREPTLSTSVKVRPDGKISMPLAGEFPAVGLTPLQLADAIRRVLGKYLTSPVVSVAPSQLNSQDYWLRVRISGEVNANKSFAYHNGMTVLDLVLAAGGISNFAAPNRTRLYRKIKVKNSDEIQTGSYVILLGDILYEGQFETNYHLQPGDIITVPKRYF